MVRKIAVIYIEEEMCQEKTLLEYVYIKIIILLGETL